MLGKIQHVEYLLSDEPCLQVLKPWFLFSMKGLTELQQRALKRKMMLPLDLWIQLPYYIWLFSFGFFLNILWGKKQGSRDLFVIAYEGCHRALMYLYYHSKYTCSYELSDKICEFHFCEILAPHNTCLTSSLLMYPIQHEKVHCRDSLSQGKRMGWKDYKLMCWLLLKGEDPEYSVAYFFLHLSGILCLVEKIL